ncbi:CoA ester lyase [Sphingomonas sp. LY160]|uniref:HpcH/HpaI aldolase/citrate lyase family protein n=1 Tax=Sphingomonas sp. LY160 TaxID=3095342 RepID=UPI002ADEEE33|nr:CoA ester lyase [Sphingomonas sp. LY160]MEA1071344.1 CoA ester lyase [Sphingomonas sp. LY160]
MTASLFDRRAVLFLPASKERAIAKARGSDADMVILDLEDAVKPEDKEAARSAAVASVAGDWPMPVAIRINGVGTEWHGGDLAAVLGLAGLPIVVPSIRSVADLHGVASVISRRPLAMIETASAVLDVREIARQSAALIVGTNDLAADLHQPAGAGRSAMAYALQSVLLAARAERVPVFDGVFNKIDDAEGFAREAAESRALGFDGKTLIHPSQIAPCHAAFAPSTEEIDRARRLVEAASGGAERFEGEMVETMHVDAARRLLDRIER